MKIGIITGSSRENSESSRIGSWFYNYISEMQDHSAAIVDLHQLPISFVPEEIWGGQNQNFNQIKDLLIDCDGYIVVAPEWGGGASPIIKNALLFLGSSVLADKPVYIVGISEGRGGQRPIIDLRAFSYKNNYACYIPEWLVVSDCKNHFTNNETDDSDYVVGRAKYGIEILLQYSSALVNVRNSNIRDLQKYTFGM